MEEIIVRLVDLENEIGDDISRLLELKQVIATEIERVDNQTYRTLLELRYLCFKDWSEIAVELNYGRRYVLKVHERAIQILDTEGHLKTLDNQAGVC